MVSTREEWQKEVREVFERIKSHTKPYSTDVDGVRLHVFPNVFSPAYFTNDKWFAETVPKIVGKNKFLEIGTGTGVVALFAALNGAEVTATDINPDAVENAKYNFQRHNVNVNSYCGDMFEPIPSGEKYDFIFWNHPFNRGTDPDEEMLLKAGFDYKYQSLEKYISEGPILSGRLLLGTGNFAEIDEIEKIAARHNQSMRLLEKVEMPLSKHSSVANEYVVYEFIR